MSPLGLRSGKNKAEKADKAKPAKPAKPAKAPKAAPAAAAQAKQRAVVVEKPKADIYTVMLILAFVAIVIACACLYGEMKAYDMNFKAR
jgi:hypothetical protein